MRLVGEREVVQLRFVATEHDDLRIRVPRMQKQRDDVAHVAIAPHANALASAMGNFIEAGDGVGGHAHKFGKSRWLDTQTLTTLSATSGKNRTTAFGRHTSTETMRFCTLVFIGLIGTLHYLSFQITCSLKIVEILNLKVNL